MASTMLQVLGLAAAACAVVLVKALPMLLGCLRAKRQFLASPIPGPDLPKSVLGHVSVLMGPRGPFTFHQWASAYGPIFKVQFLDSFGVVLSDPDTIARISKKTGPSAYLPKPRHIYQALESAVWPKRPNILTSDDDPYWRAVRQAAAPCFSMSNMKKVVPLVLELTQHVADRMAQHATFDVTDAAKRITSDVMGQLLYGEDLRGVHWEPSEYLQAFYPALKAQAALLDNPLHLWKLWDPEVRLQRRGLSRNNALMGEKVAALRQNPPAAHTIAAHLLAAIDPATGKPLDDHQLKAEISTFMAAGFETTSHAITWCLTLLASHPTIQDEVHAELQDAGLAAANGGANSSPGRAFEASDLNHLPLLSAVIKEALRVCAPAPFGGTRHVVQEEGVELCGFHVPKGTVVMLPTLPLGLAQHNYGADALSFKPQRWMASAAAHAGPDGTSPTISTDALPDPNSFLSGPRDCIGQNLAKLELQVVLATLLSRFRFSPGPELERELQLAAATGQPVLSAVHNLAGAFITLQPLSGQMVLRVTSRA